MKHVGKLKYLILCSAYVTVAATGTYQLLNVLDVTAESQVTEMQVSKECDKILSMQRVVDTQLLKTAPTATFSDEVIEEAAEVEEVAVFMKHKGYTNEEIQGYIDLGLFTREDFDYLTAVGHEHFVTYEGFYAVASCVLNRLQQNNKYSTIKQVVTADGQFTGFNTPGSSAYKKYCTQEVIDAAVDALLERTSSIGDSYYFYGRVDGFDLWVDSGCTEFYLIGGNVFVNSENYPHLHNMTSGRTSNDICIWDASTGKWCFENGYHYTH